MVVAIRIEQRDGSALHIFVIVSLLCSVKNFTRTVVTRDA